MRQLEKIPAWAWLILALVLRVAFAVKLGERFHQIDENGYAFNAGVIASRWAQGLPGEPLPIGSPLPIGFFSLLFLFGPRLLWPRLGSAVLGTAAVWVVGRMTLDLTGSPKAGRLALAIAAVYPFFIYYSGLLMTETPYILASTLGLWLLCRSLQEGGRSLWRAAGAGLALGLAALCRPEGAPIVVLIGVASALACLRRRWSWRAFGLAALFWALPLIVWSARNKSVLGSFSLDAHGGMALLHGTVLFELNEQDTGRAQKALDEMPFYQQALSLNPAERDRVFTRQALNYMLKHPGITLGQWARKLVNFWRFYPRTDKQYHESPHSHPGAGLSRWALAVISLLFEPWIIIGGFAGLWALRRDWPRLFPLPLFLLATMGIHMISVSQMRYRLPVMPILILGVSSRLSRKIGSG